MIAGIFIILFWIVLVPLGIGLSFTTKKKKKKDIVLKSYLFGLVLYLACFQVLIVANMLLENNFFHVCTIFSYSMGFLSLLGYLITLIRGIYKKKQGLPEKSVEKIVYPRSKKVESIILWVAFGGIFLFQMIQALRLTYPDGDDAYYVGTATYGANIPEMYSRIPYTGATTEFDTRHCLAPFPYVISFLSRMSHMETSIIAHCVCPVMFITFAYGIYYLMAKKLCKEKREVPLFMVIISTLFLFGNYSVYSMETFLMTRSRQGKASLGSFALPLGFYLMMLLSEKLDKQGKGQKKDRVLLYVLLACNGLVAALFTTLGNFIYPCMIGVCSLCIC